MVGQSISEAETSIWTSCTYRPAVRCGSITNNHLVASTDTEDANADEDYHLRGDIVMIAFYAIATVSPKWLKMSNRELLEAFWNVRYVPEHVTRIRRLVTVR